jgi:transcription elongation factor Elf1
VGRKGRMVKRVFKRISSTFTCPCCGSRSIMVEIYGDEAIVMCGECGLRDRVKYFPPFNAVDIYDRFVDKCLRKLKI